jgi:hypothetical protein
MPHETTGRIPWPNGILSLEETNRRNQAAFGQRSPRTIKAKITSYLDAGMTDLMEVWKTIKREHPHLHVSWDYLCQIHRERRRVNDGA